MYLSSMLGAQGQTHLPRPAPEGRRPNACRARTRRRHPGRPGCLSHARHDALIGHHVGRVGDLDADVGDVGAQGTHAEGDDVHGPPVHAALELLVESGPHLLRGHPVVGGARILLLFGADEGAVLDARHVAGVGAGKKAVGPLFRVQAGVDAGLDQLVAESIVFLLGSVAPVDAFRLAKCGHFVDPVQKFLVVGAGSAVMRGRHR